jgi:oxygen-independent coproporphyrinogen-3 oxidase
MMRSSSLGRVPPAWTARTSDDGVGLYVHLPFCDRICPYCDFAVVGYEPHCARRYLEAVLRELSETASRPVQTIYLGGGTPSLLGPAIAALLDAIFDRTGVAPGSIECTLEANPARNAEHLAIWRAAGVNRLSVGVQSFDDAELHRLGRNHDAATAAAFVKRARDAGFTNVGIDLMAGIPGQTPSTLTRTLEIACALGVPHVSLYALTVETGTPYALWRDRTPDVFPTEDAVAAMLEDSAARLSAAGFAQYEISNFALPGFECAHNIGYWRQRDCIGLGVSAAGYEAGRRYRNVRSTSEYCRRIECGESPRENVEELPWPERVGEAAILALRTAEGIEDAVFRSRLGVDPRHAFARAIEKCTRAGLLEADEAGIRLTPAGRLLANVVCIEFLEPNPAPA